MRRLWHRVKQRISRIWQGSRLSVRILTIMLFPLVLFTIGLLSVDQYKRALIRGELSALERQGVVLARSLALAEASRSDFVYRRLSPETMTQLLPLVGYGSVLRARVFQPDGTLAADTARHGLSSGVVDVRRRKDRSMQGAFRSQVTNWLNQIVSLFNSDPPMPIMPDRRREQISESPHVRAALNGQLRRGVFRGMHGQMVLSVAVPVQDLRVVRGALLLTTSGGRIENEIQQVQWVFLQIFGIVFLVTIALALYLARSITTPITKLAAAADSLRQSHDLQPLATLPNRKDEIGKLSLALTEMTNELQRRIQATAGFAADVSHELKNPLTSLRSAVETVALIEDPKQQQKLMDVILADVGRLDRLISDISEASRIDVELHRALPEPAPINELIDNWVALSQDRFGADTLRYDRLEKDVLVRFFPGRIVQILDNLLQNALSFSPEDSPMTLRVTVTDAAVFIALEDEGPGIPAGKLEAIFDRFYTERPTREGFGNHSGLGLSISRQIAEAHNGTLTAENRTAQSDGQMLGACFTLKLPLAA